MKADRFANKGISQFLQNRDEYFVKYHVANCDPESLRFFSESLVFNYAVGFQYQLLAFSSKNTITTLWNLSRGDQENSSLKSSLELEIMSQKLRPLFRDQFKYQGPHRLNFH